MKDVQCRKCGSTNVMWHFIIRKGQPKSTGRWRLIETGPGAKLHDCAFETVSGIQSAITFHENKIAELQRLVKKVGVLCPTCKGDGEFAVEEGKYTTVCLGCIGLGYVNKTQKESSDVL